MPRRVVVEDLIDVAAVARLLGLSHRNSVTTYLNRYRNFPPPVVDTGRRRCRLWSRKEVKKWALVWAVGRRDRTR
jgi:hypothetical protein